MADGCVSIFYLEVKKNVIRISTTFLLISHLKDCRKSDKAAIKDKRQVFIRTWHKCAAYVELNPQWRKHDYAKKTILPCWACPLARNRKYSWSRLKRRVSGLLILTGRLNRHCIDPSASRHDTEDSSACKHNEAIFTLFYKHFKWSDHMCTSFRKSIFTLCTVYIHLEWERRKPELKA